MKRELKIKNSEYSEADAFEYGMDLAKERTLEHKLNEAIELLKPYANVMSFDNHNEKVKEFINRIQEKQNGY